MYLNSVELAESFGVSEKVVNDWIRDEGLPHLRDRGRLMFDRARVTDWAAEHGLTARAGFLAPENGAFTTGFELAPMLRTGGIWRDISASAVTDVLERVIASLERIPLPVRGLLIKRLRATGGLNWAPIGNGFALPHFSTRVTLGRDAGVVSFVLLRDAMPLTEAHPDEAPVTRLFFFIPPSPRAHLDMLARLAGAVAKGPLRAVVERGGSDGEILDSIALADLPVGTEPKGAAKP